MPRQREQLNIRIDGRLHNQLRARAEAEDETVAAVLREAIRRYLAQPHQG